MQTADSLLCPRSTNYIRPLFDAPQSPGDIAYDVTPDGKRFLFEMTGKSGRPMALTLVIHWTSGQQK